jgi:hypothetical protein
LWYALGPVVERASGSGRPIAVELDEIGRKVGVVGVVGRELSGVESVLADVLMLVLRSVTPVVAVVAETFDSGRRAVDVAIIVVNDGFPPAVLRASMLRPVAEETDVDMRNGMGVRSSVGLCARSAARWFARRRSRSRSGDGEPFSDTNTQEVSPSAARRLSSIRPPVTVRLRGERSSEPGRMEKEVVRGRTLAL